MIKHLNRDAGHWLESSPLPCLIFLHTQQGFGVTMTRSITVASAEKGRPLWPRHWKLHWHAGHWYWNPCISRALLVTCDDPAFLVGDPNSNVTMSVWCLIVMEAVVEDNRVQYMMWVCESGWAREREREREHDDHTHKLCVKLKAHSPSIIYVWKVKERGQ